MGNWLGGGNPVDGTYLEIPSNFHHFAPMAEKTDGVGGAVAGPGENGQWNFISSGSSSFSDGKNQYTGSQMYSNLNGQVHHETTGNMPPGFFQSFSSTPAATVSAIVLVSMVVMVAIFSIFIRITRKSQQKRQIELRNRRNVLMTTFNSGRNFTEEAEPHDGHYFNQQKRPFADVMWNSELLAEDQFVELNMDG